MSNRRTPSTSFPKRWCQTIEYYRTLDGNVVSDRRTPLNTIEKHRHFVTLYAWEHRALSTLEALVYVKAPRTIDNLGTCLCGSIEHHRKTFD